MNGTHGQNFLLFIALLDSVVGRVLGIKWNRKITQLPHEAASSARNLRYGVLTRLVN